MLTNIRTVDLYLKQALKLLYEYFVLQEPLVSHLNFLKQHESSFSSRLVSPKRKLWNQRCAQRSEVVPSTNEVSIMQGKRHQKLYHF